LRHKQSTEGYGGGSWQKRQHFAKFLPILLRISSISKRKEMEGKRRKAIQRLNNDESKEELYQLGIISGNL
jgi:hypothetical protein